MKLSVISIVNNVSTSVSQDEGCEETKRWQGRTAGKGKSMSKKNKKHSYIEEIEQGGEELDKWLIINLCSVFIFCTWGYLSPVMGADYLLSTPFSHLLDQTSVLHI